jgi:hypothetical protein
MTTAFRALAGCACVAFICAFATGGAAGFRVRSFRFTDPSRTMLLPDGRRGLRADLLPVA